MAMPVDDRNTININDPDAPLLCEDCRGVNPHPRMLKDTNKKDCKTCKRPFTVYKWNPGTKTRLRKPEVCLTCSMEKNVCGCCLRDLDHAMALRRRANANAAREAANREAANREAAVIQDRELAVDIQKVEACSGPSIDEEKAAALENADLPDPSIDEEKAAALENAEQPQPARDIIPIMAPEVPKEIKKFTDMPKLEPPEDKTITTLYVGNLGGKVSETDLVPFFNLTPSDLPRIEIVSRDQCAFVHFTTRQAAEVAAHRRFNRITIHGQNLNLKWGRPKSGNVEMPNVSRIELQNVLMDVDCTKQANHKNYIPFYDFNLQDIPENYRNEKVYQYIKDFGKRVVLIETVVENSVQKGCGVVFRAGEDIFIQTNTNITVDSDKLKVMFDFDQDGKKPDAFELNKVDKIGEWPCQDKVFYQIFRFPMALGKITDIEPLIVDIEITEDKVIKGLVEYCKDSKNYFIHASAAVTPSSPTKCQVYFSDDKTQQECIKITQCNPKGCSKVHITQDIPKSTTKFFTTKCPWKLSKNPLVVVISHPHGKAKRISFGSRLSFSACEQQPPFCNELLHDAATCPGSTGGCVLLIGEDTTEQLGYFSHLGMHQGTDKNQNKATIGLLDEM